MNGETVLILGGGVGGLVTANTLRSLLPSEHRIVLIEKKRDHYLGATLPWVMLGEKTARQITRSLDRVKKRKIELVPTEIQQIDAEKREIQTASGRLQGDYLVIALGADYNMEAFEGLKNAETFYHLEGARHLRETLQNFKGGDVVILVPRTPFKCPPAPYETAMLLQTSFKRRGVSDRTRLDVYTVEPMPMATAGRQVGEMIVGYLQERGIGFHPQKQLQSVDPSRRRVKFQEGSEVSYDLLIAVPPHEAPQAVKASGLTNKSGWVPADPKSLRTEAERVYAIGDVSVIPLPGRWKPDVPLVLPKAAVFADQQGRVVAAHIAGDILGKEPSEFFNGKGFCYIETDERVAMRGDGEFFTTPNPVMNFQPPSTQLYREKEEWVRNWMDSNLG